MKIINAETCVNVTLQCEKCQTTVARHYYEITKDEAMVEALAEGCDHCGDKMTHEQAIRQVFE